MKTTFFAMLTSILISCNQDQQKKTEILITSGQTVELAPFTLRDYVSEEMLFRASEALQHEFVEKQTGFIKRDLVKKSEKEYVDIVYWDSKTNADKAAHNAMNSPACFAYFQLIKDADQNDPTAGVTHYQLVNTYK